MSRALLGGALAAAVVVATESARAEGPCTPVRRANVVACALGASLASRAERQAELAAEGRRVAARPLFPSNPVLSGTISQLSTGSVVVPNWGASLSQEIEIGGQRGARLDAADAEVAAQRSRVLVTDRDVAADALRLYFDALAAEEARDLGRRLETATRAAAAVARGRAEKGVASTVDADIAEAAALHATDARLQAEQRAAQATAALASSLALDPAAPPSVEGDLTPLAGVDTQARALAARGFEDRPEVQALEAQRRAATERASVFRRSRVPNVTVLAFAQNDDLNDRILGLGLSVPLPLPEPIGRMHDGEVAEADALAARAATEAERLRRELRLGLATALSAYETRREAVTAYAPERAMRAEQDLAAMVQEIEAGRLSVRDAIVAQGLFVELLQARLEARRAICLASVELARAAGLPLERQTL
jgi:cobalt-zinc-cadmium efflux system outer membrane protein